MSLRVGRLVVDDPSAWPEPVGGTVGRVGGMPIPGERGGVSLSPTFDLAPPGLSAKADRFRLRRQYRALVNNRAACLRGVWVEWSEDSEQDGWYVPAQSTVDMQPGSLVSGLFGVSGGFELVGRPRTHRLGLVARVRDLRKSTEPKDTLRRVYGKAFDGSGGVGSNVTPAPIVWLPSNANDVVTVSVSATSLGTARTGRGGSSVVPVSGMSDLAIAHFEQTAAARHLGDVVVYDRRGQTGSTPSTGPHADWEETPGPDWPWIGDFVIDNTLTRIVPTGSSWVIQRWDGTAYASFALASFSVPSSGSGVLSTWATPVVLEASVDRVVVMITGWGPAADNRANVVVTLQRGWYGPLVEVYPTDVSKAGTILISLTGGITANNVPAAFTSNVNNGYLNSSGYAVTVAVTHPSTTTSKPSSDLLVTRAGYVGTRFEWCPSGGGASAAPVLGADMLSDVKYPQTVVSR